MKRIVIAVLSTISGLVLLFSYPTSTNKTVADTAAPAAGAGTTTGAGTSGAAAAGSAATTAPTTAAAPAVTAKSGTFTGSTVQTRWGPVQVQIVVANGKITSADAVQYPNGNGRDQQINSYAIPQLNAEAVKASSAKIDMVSGATVTSGGYLQSLQNAIDQAFK